MTWKCDLWPQAAPPELTCTPGLSVPIEAVFPSARQAIAQSLSDAGHAASSRIGYPPFVSACVPRAISKAATPISTGQRITTDNVLRLDGLLVHEQWGWPLRGAALDRLLRHSAHRLLAIDRVDSADFFRRSIDHPDVVEILSLSKTLGLLGGGLARKSSRYSLFESRPLTPRTRHALERLAAGRPGEPYREFFKNSDQAIHPGVSTWLSANSVVAALEHERVRRQCNVKRMQLSPLADGWPDWMHEAISSGAGPDLAPCVARARTRCVDESDALAGSGVWGGIDGVCVQLDWRSAGAR